MTQILRILTVATASAALAVDGCKHLPPTKTNSNAEKPARSLFVAPNGNDAADGSEQAPLASLEAARNRLRALKKTGLLKGGATVFVRGGTYSLTNAFVLASEDGGTSNAPVVYRAYRDEKPILSGTRIVSGLTPYRRNILKTDLAPQGLKGIAFRQLFFNRTKQILARYPNVDPANPYGGGYAYVDGPLKPSWSMYHDETNDCANAFPYREEDARTWAHPETGEVNLFPRYNWMNGIFPIASVDRNARMIHLTHSVGYKAIRPYDRYYVQNLMEELDTPGEWFLDRTTWTLYFWPPGPVRTDSVRVPVTDNLVRIADGTAWITFQGFTLEGCDGAGVYVTKADHCLIAGNTLRNVAGRFGPAAIEISGGYGCGAVGNDISDAENGGIRISGGDTKTLAPGGHYADNNYIHHIGRENGHSCGIWLSGAGLRVSHNLIHDITRCGVFGGGPNCVIEYNRIRHVNLETEDTGGRYGGGMWHIRGEIIRYNFVTDTLGYGRRDDRWTSPCFSWGIYLDDDQSYAQVYGNIAARTTSGGCHIHAGRNNIVFNNIFVDSSGPQIQFSGHDPKSPLVAGRLKEFAEIMKNPAYRAAYPDLAATDTNTVWHMAENKTHGNIVYYTDPKARLYGISHVPADPFEQNMVNANLIWHGGQALKIDRNGKSLGWDEWRKAGFDTGSVVADPLFVDPAHDDYRLKPESPALRMGFTPIPVDRIGPYPSDQRACWPIVEVPGVREHPLPKARVLLWPDTAPNGDGTRELTDAAITVFLPPKEIATGAAIIICPGGGYRTKVLTHEGSFIARWLNAHGIAGVVLDYRLPHGRHAVPLADAQRAIRLVRANAAEWSVQTNRIGIMGFSAGGHLASTAGTHFDAGDSKAQDEVERQSCRPDFMALIYPVIRMGENGNTGTQLNLFGENPAPEPVARYSNERQVTARTPPTFLAHAQDDRVVPPSNSADFFNALKAHGVATKYLQLPSGGHGLNGYKGPMWEAWQSGLIEWLNGQGFTHIKPPFGLRTRCSECH